MLTASGQVVHPLVQSSVSRAVQPDLIIAIPVEPGAAGSQLTVHLTCPDGSQQAATTPVDAPSGSRGGVLLFRIPTQLLQDGDHQLQISGQAQDGPWVRSVSLTVVP